MAQRVEIQCIRKQNRLNPHERIQSVGGVHLGQAWELALDVAIAGALGGTYDFYVTVGGYTVNVEVERHDGHPYLKTVPDGTKIDNLLSLPNCGPR